MSHLLQPSIILLRDGTDTSQGIPQLLSNIDACAAVVDIVKTTLGPFGMDKLIHTNDRGDATISNDGATIVDLLDIEHPAAKCLCDIAQSQDAEVGDGTTTVMILAGEFMKVARKYIEDRVHPKMMIRAFQRALKMSIEFLDAISEKGRDIDKETLVNCAATALTSKLIGGLNKRFFAEMVCEAVQCLDEEELSLDSIGVKKVSGGSMEDSMLVKGVAFKKTFSYAGFEQQPKSLKNPKVICMKIELELKAEASNAQVRVKNPEEFQQIVDAEWQIIYDKLDNIARSGATVVLSQLAIGDLATQYFADRNIFCAGRVEKPDLQRVCKATGARILTTVTNIKKADVLGTCGLFEERQVGKERFNFFKDCTNSKTATIILRGGAEQFIEESARSLHDAIMVVRRTIRNRYNVVAGGGATEMALSSYLRKKSRLIKGKDQLLIASFAKALEVIPRQLAENAGFNSIDILNKLRYKHDQIGFEELDLIFEDSSKIREMVRKKKEAEEEETEGEETEKKTKKKKEEEEEETKKFNKFNNWWGVDIHNEGICDTMKSFVWEPALVKRNAIIAATQAATLILSIDETVKNPKADKPDMQSGARMQQAMKRM